MATAGLQSAQRPKRLYSELAAALPQLGLDRFGTPWKDPLRVPRAREPLGHRRVYDRWPLGLEGRKKSFASRRIRPIRVV